MTGGTAISGSAKFTYNSAISEVGLKGGNMTIKGQSAEGWHGDIVFTNDVSDADDNGIAIYGGSTVGIAAGAQSGSNDYAIKVNSIGTSINATTNDYPFLINTRTTASQDFRMEKDLRLTDGKITIDQQTIVDASPLVWNQSKGSNAKVTLAGNRTLSITNAVTGDTGVILVKQGSGTTYNLTLPAGSVTIGGGSYTTTTVSGGTDVIGFYYDGTTLFFSIPNGAVGEKGATGATGALSITGNTNNRVLTATGGTSVVGEAGLTYNGSDLINSTRHIGVYADNKLVTDADSDQFSFILSDSADAYGYGSDETIYASAQSKHVFIEGDGNALGLIQSDSLIIGSNQTLNGTRNSIVGGANHLITPQVKCSIILGGCASKISGSACYSSILGGRCNVISGSNNAQILGGYCNCIGTSGNCSTILGGNDHHINNSYSSILAGTNITTTANSTAYATNMTVTQHLQVGGTTTMNTTTGRIDATNDVVAYATSDRRLKENIKPIEHAIDKVERINGVNFDWKELDEESIKNIHGNKGHDIGVIAQEIEKVLPDAVTTRESGYKAVNYEKIIPLLIEAIKEQQIQIDQLKRK